MSLSLYQVLKAVEKHDNNYLSRPYSFNIIDSNELFITVKDFELLLTKATELGLLRVKNYDLYRTWYLTELGFKFLYDEKIGDINDVKRLLVKIKSLGDSATDKNIWQDNFDIHFKTLEKIIQLGLTVSVNGIYSLTEFGEEFLLESSC